MQPGARRIVRSGVSPTSVPVHLGPRSSLWPPELLTIEAAPDELWIRGREELLSLRPRVAIVGARAATAYGAAQARRFAERFAVAGVVVVSGLARGVDEAAHERALDSGGATIAVLGGGVDRPWPAGPLAARMESEGLLVSEFPPGTPPRRHHFPRRNRLISGLAQAVVVIEAAASSGSLITAHWAADQGRAVFALPGRVDHPMARGAHRLIREGATLVEDPDEVLQELGLALPTRERREPLPGERDRSPLCAALVGETASAEELALRLERDPSEVLTDLVELELRGAVVRGPGGLYRLPD